MRLRFATIEPRIIALWSFLNPVVKRGKRETFYFRTPRSFIRGIIHHPSIALEAGQGKERLGNQLGTQEEQEFPPVTASLLKETVDGVFPSLERIVPGMEEAGEAFPGKGKEKDHLKDLFDRDSFLLVNIAFP